MMTWLDVDFSHYYYDIGCLYTSVNIFYLNLLFSVPVSLDLLDGRSRHKCRSHMNFFTPSFRVVWRINTIPKKEWEFILHLP